MWLCQGLSLLLLLVSMLGTYGMEFYAAGGRYGKRPVQPPAIMRSREIRSGIFWTGSRYNRRGSDTRVAKQRKKDSFFMNGRYGKRTGNTEDLCKYTNYQTLYPCNSR
ncbi:uncharacterized protein isoform X2 [Rhodnius prolixus]